ncbi:SPOR domain-containing protein [Pseudomonas sp. nanlin1]|uniref:SPOR domain-containing protein n=1 Tax=Pseudomonas sp. nanlin1 TaxID=3040605 RepID=UPI00388FD5B9
MRKVTLMVAMAVLAGCGTGFEAAQQAVIDKLETPKGARFTNVRTTAEGNVCGQVKMKNPNGGYDGYRSYVALKRGSTYEAVIDQDGRNPQVLQACGTPEEIAANQMADAGVVEQAGQRWEVRIVQGRNMGAVTDMAARLVENGFVASFAKGPDGQTQVYLGPFDNKPQADAERARLMASRGIESIVVPHEEAAQ